MNRVAFILLLALCCVGATRRSFFAPKPATAAGGDGPNTWYWSGSSKGDSDYTDGVTQDVWDPHLNGYGAAVVVAQAGTCTKIAAKLSENNTGETFKIALYNSGNELLADGDVNVTGTTPTWYEVNISTNVAAATYKIMLWCSGPDGEYSYDTSSGNSLEEATDYGDAPPTSVSTSAVTDYLFGVKMYVD